MPERYPTRTGFRTVLRTPSLWLAEIAWRWCFGLAAWVLVFLSMMEFLRSLPVSRADTLFLHSNNPLLVSAALGNVFGDTGPRLLRIGAVLLPGIALMWMVAATLGRAATLKNLLPGCVVRFRSIMGLNFLRAAVSLTAVVSFFGAAVLAGYAGVSPAEDPLRAGDRSLSIVAIFLGIALVVATVWALLNWILALAAVFAVRHRHDPLSAAAHAVRVFRAHLRCFLATGTWFGLLHLVAAVGASYAAILAVPLATLSKWAALIFVVIIAGLYFAIVDFLYIARLAAYIVITEPPAPELPPVPAEPAPAPPALAQL